MKQKIILLYANCWSMKDDNGNPMDGVSCNYYFNTELKAIGNADGSVGQRPAKCSLPTELFFKIKKAPAIYEATFDMSIGADGKPVLKIVDLEYIEEVMLTPISQQSDKLADKKAG